jgi:hypothetical protein
MQKDEDHGLLCTDLIKLVIRIFYIYIVIYDKETFLCWLMKGTHLVAPAIHGINSWCNWLEQPSCKIKALGRRHTKETGNRNATAISENSYQPELNTWN